MDSDDEYHGFYSSQERSYQTYAYDSNEEEGQHQWYNQYQSYNEQRYENDGGYDGEGYGYEDRIRAYSQQNLYGGIYDQGEGYHNPQWEEQYYSTHLENPMWGEGDESLYEKHAYDHYPPGPQLESSQRDTIMALMSQYIDQQKEMAERLNRMEAEDAQQALEIADMVEAEGSSNEEDLGSFEDQCMKTPLEVVNQPFEEGSDELIDYLLNFFSNIPYEDEQIPHLEEALEGEHETPRGLDIHEDLFDDACEGLSRETPSHQEGIRKEEDIESWTPKCQNQIVEDWLSIESWSSVEDPYLFTPPPSKFLSFRPYMDASIEWNSYDPSTPKESNLAKGSKSTFDVHLKLGGRKFKWDIKIS